MSRISILFDRTDLQSPGSYERQAAQRCHTLERATPAFEAREQAEDFAVYLPPSDDAR